MHVWAGTVYNQYAYMLLYIFMRCHACFVHMHWHHISKNL